MVERVSFSSDACVFTRANRAYKRFAEQLARLLPSAAIDHIGSTSVANSLTKGDLDIGVGVEQLAFERSATVLAAYYNVKNPSDRTSELCAFEAVDESLAIGIQLYAQGSIVERRFLTWRDALNSDPRLLDSYNDLKTRFEGRPMSEYRQAKSQFIRRYLGEQ